jgi:hypothetical protein
LLLVTGLPVALVRAARSPPSGVQFLTGNSPVVSCCLSSMESLLEQAGHQLPFLEWFE